MKHRLLLLAFRPLLSELALETLYHLLFSGQAGFERNDASIPPFPLRDKLLLHRRVLTCLALCVM